MKTNKVFDAVKMMCEIRCEISMHLNDKSFEERRLYIQEHISSFNVENYGKLPI